MTRAEKLEKAIDTFLNNHLHETRKEPGCICGDCYEMDPDCPCYALRASLNEVDDEDPI